jgi:hypothetical protein
MANPTLPMRPYTSGLNRGAGVASGLGATSSAQQNARLERERAERAERERIQREQAAAAVIPPRIEDLSEEQREEINEAVCICTNILNVECVNMKAVPIIRLRS